MIIPRADRLEEKAARTQLSWLGEIVDLGSNLSLALSLHMARINSSKAPLLPKFFGEGLTFDDVLLLPAHSEVLPRETDIRTSLTKKITLHIPMLSAAMDTVTEATLAIALAREGGMGILHKNMPIEKQVEQVRKVKRSESGLIIDPITLHPEATIADALTLMKENKIGGIPIIDNHQKLVGILTNRDLRFEDDRKRKIREVMTKKRNLICVAPEGTDLKMAEAILRKHKVEKLPVVSKSGKLIGLITYRDILQLSSFPLAVKDDFGRLRVGAALGITLDLLDRAAALQQIGVDIACLDSAHGHNTGVIEALKKVKKNFPKLQVIAGNVGTAAGAKALAAAGADAVKIGVGPGSICTTRIVTGAGVPQITAILEAASVLKPLGIPLIADGGIRYTGRSGQSRHCLWCECGDDGKRFCRNRRKSRRDHYLRGQKIQAIPRHGISRRHDARQQRPVFSGRGRWNKKARSGRN